MQSEKPWSAAAVKLLRGPVYKKREKKDIWESILTYKSSLDDYFGVIGLSVFLETIDGYAFLREAGERLGKGMEDEDDEESAADSKLPHLIKKTPLSYQASMLLVLLRYEIEKFETGQSESECLVMRKSEIVSLYRSFTKERADELRQMKTFDSTLRTLCRLTFLFVSSDALGDNEISDDAEFELSPIIKARIDTEFMKELLLKMKKAEKSTGEDGR